METRIHALLADDDFAITVRWQEGAPPDQNDDFIKMVYGDLNSVAIPSFGEITLIIDGGPQVGLEDVYEALRHHGYEPAIAVPL